MSVVAVYLDSQDVEDNINLLIYDVKDDSVEGLKKFLTTNYPGIQEDSIQFYCFKDGSVYYATFTNEEEDFDYQELHWKLEVKHVIKR